MHLEWLPSKRLYSHCHSRTCSDIRYLLVQVVRSHDLLLAWLLCVRLLLSFQYHCSSPVRHRSMPPFIGSIFVCQLRVVSLFCFFSCIFSAVLWDAEHARLSRFHMVQCDPWSTSTVSSQAERPAARSSPFVSGKPRTFKGEARGNVSKQPLQQ